MTEQSEVIETRPKAKKKSFVSRLKKSRIFLVLVVLIIAAIPSYYFYNKSIQAERRLKDPNTANQEVIDEVVKKVSRLILLPTNEQPTLASVSDVDKVKGQAFFANAENGDKVLVYTQARKAILYRPSKDIIVEVAPLNVSSLEDSNPLIK